MVTINELDPKRFREGDTIKIKGFGFNPDFSTLNDVLIDEETAVVGAFSDTELEVTVPAGIDSDGYVGVLVARADTSANDATSGFSKAPLADLRSGAIGVPGQVPGVTEAADDTFQDDVPQAQDYERMVTFAEWILYEILATKGDLFAHDGAALLPFGVGAAGTVLQADPGATEGLTYGALTTQRVTLSWGKRIDAGNGNNGAMVAGGHSDDASVVAGEHGCGLAGTVDQVTVRVQAFTAGDTLDQVQVALNGVVSYDSGTGLGLTTFHAAALAIAVVAGDRLEIRAFKAGTAGLMRLRGKLGF